MLCILCTILPGLPLVRLIQFPFPPLLLLSSVDSHSWITTSFLSPRHTCHSHHLSHGTLCASGRDRRPVTLCHSNVSVSFVSLCPRVSTFPVQMFPCAKCCASHRAQTFSFWISSLLRGVWAAFTGVHVTPHFVKTGSLLPRLAFYLPSHVFLTARIVHYFLDAFSYFSSYEQKCV